MDMIWLQVSLLTIFTLTAFYSDIRYSKIPNWLTLSGFILGIIHQAFAGGFHGVFQAILGAAAGFGVTFVLYLFGGIGAGDVKLFAALGAMTGAEFLFYTMMYSVLYAGAIGLVILLVKKQVVRRMGGIMFHIFSILILKKLPQIRLEQTKEMLQFPFMWAVVPALLTCGYEWMA